MHVRPTIFVALVLVGTTAVAVASAGHQTTRPCTWGASSITAQLVDGKWIVGKPHTSGCIPQP